ncbi:MAG: riboflavin biosynthesis protein RibF [Planctomycetales bacterium]|nr:riboflavin biosynthesis protein RibF [Planctomycetales bacterium]
MRIINDEQQISGLPKGMVLSIGNFDGVHRGHQAILSTARTLAHERKVPFAVITFDPHPMSVLHPERAPGILTPLPIKAMLLEAMSVDVLIVIRDSMAVLNLSPDDFVDQLLMKNLSPLVVVEGPDFNFGYGRSGTIRTLHELSVSRGFEAVEVPFEDFYSENDRRGMKCSSTAIRQLLEEGDVWQASQILGRPYRLAGKTVPGRGIGRQLGFPTANIQPIPQIVPAEGVYAGYAVVGDSVEEVAFGGLRRPAAISIGRAKTFISDHPLLLEAHFLEDRVEDLKGKWLAMDFMRFIRHQRRFETYQLLQKQIAKDCQKAMNFLL